MYKFFYNESLSLLRITLGKNSIALQVGPNMAEFFKKLVETANNNNFMLGDLWNQKN